MGADDIALKAVSSRYSLIVHDDHNLQLTASTTVSSTVPAKEDLMQSTKHIPIAVAEVAVEIASILARGFMRCRTGAKSSPDSEIERRSAADIEESETIAEKPLDCSRPL